jgi:MFS family permease
VVTPLSGLAIDRVGPRLVLGAALASAAGGALLTLGPSVAAVVAGLALASTGAFVAQAAATAHLADAAPGELRSGASGLYLSCYYLGGAAGGALPVLAWRAGGWAACVALVVTVQAATLALGLWSWPRPRGARLAPAGAAALPAPGAPAL